MTVPRVSVCVVAYNHERYIHDCIMTVLAQAHDVSLEVLIGDDQSTDQTEEIAGCWRQNFPMPSVIFVTRKDWDPAGIIVSHLAGARRIYRPFGRRRFLAAWKIS